MNTIISNNIKIYDPTLQVEDFCEKYLMVKNPTYDTLIRIGQIDTIRRRHIQKDMKLFSKSGNSITLPFGVLYAIWDYIKDSPIDTNFNKVPQIGCLGDKITQSLFDYQEEAVRKMLHAKGGVLVAPCSAGKTNIMIELIHRIGEKFLFIVHTSDLLRQFYDRAKKLYPNMDIGKITDGEVEIGRDGAVATVQTLDKIDKDLYKNEFYVVICDECAHVSGSPTLSKMFSRVVGSIPARYKFGCTATPERTDTLTKTMYTILGVNQAGRFEPVHQIEKSQTRSLTAQHLEVKTGTPFSYDILKDDGTFDFNTLIDYLSTNEERNNLIIDIVKKETELSHKVLILCHRIEQCEILQAKMEEENIKSAILVGKVSNKKREDILNERTDWDIIVATYSLAKEGLDLPCLNTLIMSTPVNDKGMTIQCAGRIERFKEGKETPTIYDLCDEKIPYCVSRFRKRQKYLFNRK